VSWKKFGEGGIDMDKLRVTGSFKWSQADIMAEAKPDGGVRIWFYFKDIQQDRYDIDLTAVEWDRLVAWIEWQRKEVALQKKPATPEEGK